MKSKRSLIIAVILVITIAVFSFLIVKQREDHKTEDHNTTVNQINNFAECKDAGGSIGESSPEQCFIDGKSFTNEEPVQKEGGDLSMENKSLIFSAAKDSMMLNRISELSDKPVEDSSEVASSGSLRFLDKLDKVLKAEIKQAQ